MNAEECRIHADIYRSIALSWLFLSEFDAAQRNADRAKAYEIAASVLERKQRGDADEVKVMASTPVPVTGERETARLTHGAVTGGATFGEVN